MAGNSGVAVAVPCLVLSTPPTNKGAHQPVPGLVSLKGSLDGAPGPLALVKSDTGEMALINTHAGESMALGGSHPLGEALDASRVAYVRTQSGETTPIVLGADLGVHSDDFGSSVSRLCSMRSEAGTGGRGPRDEASAACGVRDESERLAQYNETLTLLMEPPECGPNDSSTSENTNHEGGCSGREQAGEHPPGGASLPGGWFGQPSRQHAEDSPQGMQLILEKLAQKPNGVRCSDEGSADKRGDVKPLTAGRCGGGAGAVLQWSGVCQGEGFKAQRVGPVVPVFNDSDEGQFAGVFVSDSEKEAKGEGDDAAAVAPYYVAFQKVKKQRQDQQQQQQQLALWWQAYLSGLYNGYGLASGPGSASTPPRPPPMPAMHSMSLPPGWMVNAGAAGTIQEMHEDGSDERMDEFDYCGQKRSRVDAEMHGPKLRASKKGRKRTEDRVCSNCATRTTPFWRKDRHSGKPLCNACGLYFSKNDVPRPISLWRSAANPYGSTDS